MKKKKIPGIIRRAKISDRHSISRLTKKCPDTLGRSPEQIAKIISHFFVALGEKGEIAGCCGYQLWENDAEIISWIVEKKYRGSRIGKDILLSLLKDMRKKKNIKKIFVVTVSKLAKKYFQPLGFLPTGLQMFSPKVLEDCQRCPKNCFKEGKYQCNEIALILKRPERCF